MTKALIPGLIGLMLTVHTTYAPTVKTAAVPAAVKTALTQKYPNATAVTWEKEKGNYEASWGGKSKEDNEVLFTPEGKLVQTVVAIPTTALPIGVVDYVKKNYPGARLKEAGKVTAADGKIGYEVEVNKKDMIFDASGNFVRTEED